MLPHVHLNFYVTVLHLDAAVGRSLKPQPETAFQFGMEVIKCLSTFSLFTTDTTYTRANHLLDSTLLFEAAKTPDKVLWFARQGRFHLAGDCMNRHSDADMAQVY